MSDNEQDEFEVHGNDPVLKAEWEKVKEVRDRNKQNIQLLQNMNAVIDPFSVVFSRINLLAQKLLTHEQRINFEREYEELIEEKLVEAQAEVRKAALAAPNLSTNQLDQLMKKLDQFKNGKESPPSGGLYRG